MVEKLLPTQCMHTPTFIISMEELSKKYKWKLLCPTF